MQIDDEPKKHFLIRITKIDQFLRFFKFLKEFSVDKFKKLYQKGKDLIQFFSDTKKILILSRFTIQDVLAFTEIQQELEISSSLLSYNLRQMTQLGFIERIYRQDRENNKFSYYKLTDLGQKVVSQLFYPGL